MTAVHENGHSDVVLHTLRNLNRRLSHQLDKAGHKSCAVGETVLPLAITPLYRL